MSRRWMSRGSMVVAVALAASSVHAAPASAQELAVDTSGAAALIDQALSHSAVMQNLEYLTDVIGPRLTGSPATRRAAEWTLERFRAYGLEGHHEPWRFGGTWRRGAFRARLLGPREHEVAAASWAWSSAT